MKHNKEILIGLALSITLASGPASARFVSVDPVQADPENGQNFNRYYYGNNNPYKFTDPDGRKSVIEGDDAYKKGVQEVRDNVSSANPELKQRIDTMEQSSHIHRIVPASENPNVPGTPSNTGEGGTLADESNGIGTGTVTYFDPTQTITSANGVVSGPGEVLSHEYTGHGFDKDQGTIDRSINPETGQKRSEEKAIDAEQKYRQGTGNEIKPNK